MCVSWAQITFPRATNLAKQGFMSLRCYH